MPLLNLKIAPLQNPEQYTAISRRLAAITAEILDKRSEVTAIAIDDLPAARWSIGSEPPARPTAMLEISITRGTNTAEQKERFIAAAFAALERELAAGGPLEAASYVVVRELPAGDWGYGGRTQLARQLEREREQAAARKRGAGVVSKKIAFAAPKFCIAKFHCINVSLPKPDRGTMAA